MHTHALDCVIDPRMPAAIRPVRWPELHANPLQPNRHRAPTLPAPLARRLLAAAIAQHLDQE